MTYLPGRRTMHHVGLQMVQSIKNFCEKTGLSNLALQIRKNAITTFLGHYHSPEWVKLYHELSEPSGYFFNDNVVSNEIEYLTAEPALRCVPTGSVFLSVGPDQTLSYLGLCDCSLAFIVDVRRNNALLHFLYRAIFEIARSRSEWLSMLLGRLYSSDCDPGPSASIEEVFSHATRRSPTKNDFNAVHERLITHLIEKFPGMFLPLDRNRLKHLHRWFWLKQLDITFELEGLHLRRYPTFQNLLRACSPDGKMLSFLAAEVVFQKIKRMEQDSRVIPVVGNFAGNFSLKAIGRKLHEEGQLIGAIYVSNVEQYLFEHRQWAQWIQNLHYLPCHPETVIIRSFFKDERGPSPDPPSTFVGQLKRSVRIATKAFLEPEKRPIHQMSTVVHRLQPFLECEKRKGYRSYREVVCDPKIAWKRDSG